MGKLGAIGRRISKYGTKVGIRAMGVTGPVVRPLVKGTMIGARNFTRMPKSLDNTSLKVGLGITATGAGFLSQVGPATKEAALDVALGSPDADVAFTGRDLDARFIAGSAMGGITGGFLAGTSTDIAGTGAFEAESDTAVGGTMAFGAVGAGLGGRTAYRLSRNRAANFGKIGRGLLKGGTGGLGAVIGGLVGAGAFMGLQYGSARAAASVSDDEYMDTSVFSEGARNSTAAISAITRASGDIVFGMHNTRGGM